MESKRGKIWNSGMSRNLTISLFIAKNESIQIYGCESWTLTGAQERSIDGTYTRMLRKVLKIHWSSHISDEELYGEIPYVSNNAVRRLQLAVHCYELSTQRLVLLVLYRRNPFEAKCHRFSLLNLFKLALEAASN